MHLLKKEKNYSYIEAGEGTPIIILHGLMGGLSNFDAVTKYFSTKGYRVIIPELPIYTMSLLKTNVKSFAKYLHDFIAFKELEDIILLGNSLGGHIGLYHTKLYPEKIKALVITGSSGLYESAMGGGYTKRSDYEVDEKWFKPNTPEINVEGLPVWMRVPEKELTFENSYVNIVTESAYINSDFIVHITEKSFRPFYHYQLPIFVASHHHIGHLKETYGFDMFDDIIDHSYDDVINHRDRLFKIVDEIKRLNGKKEEIKEFYKNNYERFEKNKIQKFHTSLFTLF